MLAVQCWADSNSWSKKCKLVDNATVRAHQPTSFIYRWHCFRSMISFKIIGSQVPASMFNLMIQGKKLLEINIINEVNTRQHVFHCDPPVCLLRRDPGPHSGLSTGGE